MNKEQILDKLLDFLDSCIGDSEQPNKQEAEVAVVKSVDQLEKRCMFVILEPQDGSEYTSDAHGDWYSASDVAEACANFNVACRKAGIDHAGLLSNDDVVIEQSYTSPCDFTTDAGVFIKKGTWLQWWKFNNDALFQGVLDGTYTGVSIECSAVGYEVE
jgi:hypothetical protein